MPSSPPSRTSLLGVACVLLMLVSYAWFTSSLTSIENNNKVEMAQVNEGDCSGTKYDTGSTLALRKQAVTELCNKHGGLCDYAPVTASVRSGAVSLDAVRAAVRRVPVQCPALFDCFAQATLDVPGQQRPPPRYPPSEFGNDFTMGGRASLGEFYLDDQFMGGNANEKFNNHWTPKWVDKLITMARNRNFFKKVDIFPYESSETELLTNALAKAQLSGAHVLVVGSITPWVEALILHAGATHVTTVEYGKLYSTDPRVEVMLTDELSQKIRTGNYPKFDAAVSFSSLEHSGFGRYGDAVNPFGDIFAVARLTCLVKKGGRIVVGVPSAAQDGVEFNAHRIYGNARWAFLLSNTLPVAYFETPPPPGLHGIFVAENLLD